MSGGPGRRRGHSPRGLCGSSITAPCPGNLAAAPSSAGRAHSPPPLLTGRGRAPPGRVVALALVVKGTGHSLLQMSANTRLALFSAAPSPAAGDEAA